MAYNNSRNGQGNFKHYQINELVHSCRVCMTRNENLTQIFDTNKENIICDKINFCTGLQVTNNDGLPTQICNKCLEDLFVAFKFKTSCLLAEKTFRNLITKSIKSEIVDTSYDDFNYDDGYEDDEYAEEPKVKEELLLNELVENGVAVRSEDKIKQENCENPTKVKVQRKKRGPYKTGNPKGRYTSPRLTCVACNIKFKSKQEFEEHKKVNHKDQDQNWICEICGKSFVHRASHYTHIKSHQPPTYGCSDCDYKTWHKHDLVKHVRIHTGVKLYQCEFCSNSYGTSSNLIGHIRRFHERTKPFACTLCEKKFYDRTKLNRHIDSHNDIKRYECDICHTCYTRRCYWKKHLLTQHNVIVPPQRPGRQKTNLIIGEGPISTTNPTVIGE